MPKTIVVGAGPGGLTVGRYLKDCLVLEEHNEIGRPVQCAEGFSKKYLDLFGIKPDPSWISTVINKTQIVLPNRKSLNILTKGEDYVIDRAKFEKFLATKSQARILLNERVANIEREDGLWRVKTDSGKVFRSKYLIGADGPLSIVRRKVFEEKIKIFPVIEYLVELERETDCSTMKVYVNKEEFMGYAWLFPKSKNKANIGLGGLGNLREKFESFLENEIKEEFGNYKLLENKSGPVPWIDSLPRLVKGNAILVGDAGGLVNPITGAGVGNAMISGRLAAEAILSGDLDYYQSKVESLFPKEIFWAREILYSLDNPTLNEIGEISEELKGNFNWRNLFKLSSVLRKPNLRKRLLEFIRLGLIFRKYGQRKFSFD